MLRLLFDPYDGGYPHRCILHGYETTWLWEKLRIFSLLLRKVWLAIWHGRGYGRRKIATIADFSHFQLPRVNRPYPVIRPEDIVGVQPMTRAFGLDSIIKNKFGS